MVRAAPNREQIDTIRWSLASAAVGGILVLSVYFALRPKPQVVPAQRSITQTTLQWVCMQNPSHAFTAEGRYDSIPCRYCNGRCFVVLDYECPRHGSYQAMVQFLGPDQSRPADLVVRYRLLSDHPDAWREAVNGRTKCPVEGCDAETHRIRSPWTSS